MNRDRKTAYQVLLEVERNQAYSNLALNQYIQQNRPENPAFVRELVYGVLKNKIYLDYLLNGLIPSGLKKVKKQDLTLLRMGGYQLMFMDGVPAYAAINETVNLARRVVRGREGFINGVLRNFQREAKNILLPDEQKDRESYLSVKYSVAPWIVRLWSQAYGEEEAERLLAASNGRASLSLRVNLQKADRQELMELLKQDGFLTEEGSLSKRALLVNGRDEKWRAQEKDSILESRYFREGYFSIQDQSSVLAVDWLGPKAGQVVVDVCAAPGGKTMAMAESMEGKGTVYAFDIYPHKLELIEKQAKRLQLSMVRTACQDGREIYEHLRGKADCVLADVPCSGLGVLRRKPEIKYKEAEDLTELIGRQAQILEAASAYVRDGGNLVYSTCTINPAENEQQVHGFLFRHRDFRLIKMEQLFPDRQTEGFFIGKLQKG
ncbi:MAG: 16S rRNA (cytosine(967)-C(5))-methyltransferase RsmB [Firmicutes bacterium]|nr:16S rRNA (cytosine(967)-C(5))-methyltransferase RsmB [Bacillota bacterium]